MSVKMYNWRRNPQFWERSQPLSVLELVNSRTFDLRLASLLWLIMGYRASVIVAAGPSSAGKSTMLNVLLDFLPPSVKQIHLSGDDEDFGSLEDTRPAETYLVASEFSNYFEYIWGDVARKAFQFLVKGYSLGGTIHARTAKEVVYVLFQYLGLPLPAIAHLDAIINLRITPGQTYSSEPLRQIESVNMPVIRDGEMVLNTIANRAQESSRFEIADYKMLEEVFFLKFGAENIDLEHEIGIREQFLRRLLEEGRIDHKEVRQAVVNYYETHTA